MKIRINQTNGWLSDRGNTIYQLTFLKPDGKLCSIDIYDNMIVCSVDAFIEEY